MSAVHVRIVTSDRTIHHFDSLEDAARWHRLPLALREPRCDLPVTSLERGARRRFILASLAARDDLSSPEMAAMSASLPDVINHILRTLVAAGLVVISGQVARGRRLYRITPAGRQVLAGTTTHQE
ncbi:hypothetical protein [Zoogloea sp.]|uniref:hypothetical protein n=1 Tax=Zoogloea sp. TaxID=49181 RepID=UPI0035B0EF27